MSSKHNHKYFSVKEDLKPTQQEINEANDRIAWQNFEEWRQAMNAYIKAGGKLVFEWDDKKGVHHVSDF